MPPMLARRPSREHAIYRVLRAAVRIVRVTVAGRESMARWEDGARTMWLPARVAMVSWAAGGRMASCVPSTYQLGRVFQAGTSDGSVSAARVIGRWPAASPAATGAGRSAAKTGRKSAVLV